MDLWVGPAIVAALVSALVSAAGWFSRNVVFDAIVSDIHILPGAVISPLIHYSRMQQRVEKFVDDLRSADFRSIAAERQLAMYADYLDMLDRVETLGRKAVQELDLSLNSSGEVPSIPTSASDTRSASASASAERKASP